MARVYIGLGSNLNAPIDQVEQAITALNTIEHTQLVKRSSLYGSKPMGPQDQPDYVNAVVALETSLTPIALLDALQAIELAFGRERIKGNRWGARVLDLDILLIDNLIINSERLVVPHYGMCEREFVLLPLAEIAPDLILPDGSKLQTFSDKIERNGLTILSSN
ncbi:2-amino-4-hydroxy-6-hydroxymethyldihydropteridine diphosphokinase [Thalassotalea sp. LPB0316]|uniref:2-amino-4-hydroxy-6- hydroxymethyldihydropteridine diphosphokinase n=1 Tax=Thalassotalea sp. LPB0316 TaxID=2769490 RepID=UPI0018684622|nr:2-amino-4-hydroxy-6-hydroxymethyldihydropteridine diphosphokinase [Thalassotalea sp. LPB0316]QOL26700.1 2-amino-4-hydroxy-6-hydroxymethyldihydropteridine diphosphokinase [Thalassotalea sp. LPB0316]